MPNDSYKHPPITEAVIQISFKRPHDKSKLDKFLKKIKNIYTDYNLLESYKFGLGLRVSNIQTKKPEVEQTPEIVHRLSSKNMTLQLLLNESSFIVSQLSPYCGWNDFISRFVRDWELWKKSLGFNEIKMIGVRYINRLDIPVSGSEIEFEHYVNIYPEIPKFLGPQLTYAIQAKIPVNELKSMLALNSAVVESPLLNYMSLVIDQDIVKTVDLPQNDESIYNYLNDVHKYKNNVFESCITDKAREIFNQ